MKVKLLVSAIAVLSSVQSGIAFSQIQSEIKPRFKFPVSQKRERLQAGEFKPIESDSNSVVVLGSEDLEKAFKDASPAKGDEVTLRDTNISTVLNEADIALIEEKRDVLIKYLFGEEELEEIRAILDERTREKKIKAMEEQQFPLTAEEILHLRERRLEVKKAENKPLNNNVNLRIRTIDFDISNPEPIDMYVSKGYASSLVLFDQTGQPWPISGDVIGDISAFTSKKVEAENVIVFELQKEFSESNALLSLKGEHTTIVLRLLSDGKSVDSRLSIRIPRMGPNAKRRTFVNSELENASPQLMTIMNGELPNGAKIYDLDGVEGEAIYHGGSIYLRTKHMLISPPWKKSATSVSGHNVYEIPPVTQLVMSVDGNLTNASIKKQYQAEIKRKRTIFER